MFAISPVHVSDSGASSTGDRCSVTRLAGVIDVHVSTVPVAQQSHSENMCYPGQQDNCNSPLVAISTVDPTPTPTVCGPPLLLSIPPRPTITAGVHLGWKLRPSARMEALMQSTTKQQDFQKRSLGSLQLLGDPQQITCTAIGGFTLLTRPQDKELIRLVPQLYSLFDTHGLSLKTIRGYGTCLASVLNHRGKTTLVQYKTISDMISSMELKAQNYTGSSTRGLGHCVRGFE